MQLTSQPAKQPYERRAAVALTLAVLGLLPCFWVLGPPAYLLGSSARRRAAARGRRGAGAAQAARIVALVDTTFLFLLFLYLLAYVAGVLASPR